MNVAGLIACQKCEFQPNVAAFVTGVAVLSPLGDVVPSAGLEQPPDLIDICAPHGNVDIHVFSSNPAQVEVDRPTAEKPIVQVLLREKRVQPIDRLQLRDRFTFTRHGLSLHYSFVASTRVRHEI